MYYQGTSDNNIQADHQQHHNHGNSNNNNIQTLYLMNPNNYMQGYTTSDTQQQQQQQHQQQLLFLNSSPTGSNALCHANIQHAPLQQQHFVGVPLPAVSLHDQINHQGLLQRMWNNQDHSQQVIVPSSTGVSATSCGGITTDLASQLAFQRPIVVSPTPQHRQQQQQQGGLSLSLSPQQQQQISFNNNISSSSPRTNNVTIRGTLDGSSSNMVLGSKYLKAAQELLDEVVNIVGKSIKGDDQKKDNSMNKESMPLASDVNTNSSGGGGGGGESSSRQKNEVAVELTTAQRQELQMKKAKLLAMLEEVEQRYRQYHHQMQIIVSSFEQVAGIGSAKSYTQLALHAISKQFRCLKDAIAEQVKATSKSLGEEEGLIGKIEGSRLKFVDHHLRQQRALQQLGMMQPNAWRPQRGLPERAVSVLRAWLFEHFLHPYPKDSDKIMLAKQTGLTRSQVSNWFINARVRLWKPMVEEMYLEEVKNQEQNSTNTSGDNKNKETNISAPNEEKHPIITSSLLQDGITTTQAEISTSTISTSPTAGASLHHAHNFSFLGSFNMDNTTTTVDHIENNAKKQRNDMHKFSPSSILSSVDMEAKARESSNKGFTNPLMAAYAMGDFGRFDPHDQQMTANFHGNNGVSLTLGLPPSENLAMPVSQQNYLSNDLGSRSEMGSHYNRMGYENIDFQSGNKRFPTQLLPDFVTGNLGT